MINETLHTFISVTKNGSFNKAAEKLSLTAPAVMKQMNSLEKSVGAPLFERTNRGIHRACADRRGTNPSSADMWCAEGGLCPSCRPPSH